MMCRKQCLCWVSCAENSPRGPTRSEAYLAPVDGGAKSRAGVEKTQPGLSQAAEPSDAEVVFVAVFVVLVLADESEVLDEEESEDEPPDSLDDAEPLSAPERARELLPEPLPDFLRVSLRESLV